jgi:phosphate:Na+ symporter
MPAFISGKREQIDAVIAIDDEVDLLYAHIVDYLRQVSQQSLSEAQTHELSTLMAAANELESMGDVIETDAASLFEACIDKNIQISDATLVVLKKLHRRISQAVEQAIKAVEHNDHRAGQDVVNAKPEINHMVDEANAHLAHRLTTEDPERPNRLAHYAVEIEMIEKLKRIYYFAKRMARGIVPKTLKPETL